MQQYCIKVKRRGFNYYGAYAERYLDKVASHFGYRLVLNPEQAEASCLWYVDESNIWMTFASDAFQALSAERLEELAALFAECLKSEAVVEVFPELAEEDGYPFYFSTTACAYDEPPFLVEGETVLQVGSASAVCCPGNPFKLIVQKLRRHIQGAANWVFAFRR